MKHEKDIHDMLAKMTLPWYGFINASKERELLEYLRAVFLLRLNQLGHDW